MFEYALFDLDGTLTDPALGITNSIIYALEKMGRDIPPRESLYSFIGPPLIQSFQSLDMTKEEAERALQIYREYFSVKGLFENTVYDGIPNALGKLNDCGIKLLLATSKPELYAKQIMEHFGLDKYFTAIYGASMDEKRVDKADVIRYAAKSAGIANLNKAVMIGDRMHDILGAKKNGIVSIGVLWGYGSEDELKEAGADYIVGTLPEMVSAVIKSSAE
jgi:phosphoglycolate phosphatase